MARRPISRLALKAFGTLVLAGLPAYLVAQQPAASAFDRLKSLAGEWIDTDGAFGMKGQVAVTYRVTGAGSAVVETLFAGGSNLDPAKDGHMHDGWIEFISDSELRAQWNGWSKGKPSAHSPRFQLARKRS